jgi:hypothetical protein
MFALNAPSLAFSAHELNGRLLPLYVNIGPQPSFVVFER